MKITLMVRRGADRGSRSKVKEKRMKRSLKQIKQDVGSSIGVTVESEEATIRREQRQSKIRLLAHSTRKGRSRSAEIMIEFETYI